MHTILQWALFQKCACYVLECPIKIKQVVKMSNCTKKEIFLYPRIIQAPFQQIKHPNSMVHLPDC
jgi:hypothetical protein